MAYYTLSIASLVYMDLTPLDPEEVAETGEKFDKYQYNIPTVEIKMFAVNEAYQDVFFEYDGDSRPISAWVFQNLIEFITELSTSTIGLKAISLHAADTYAENFYLQNNFNFFPENIE
ncbi:MAG: hypothetical protein RR614_00865, partial [Eubacterium sp.]